MNNKSESAGAGGQDAQNAAISADVPAKRVRESANSPRLRGPRPVCFDGQFIGCTEKTFRELRAAAKLARQSLKEERGVLQALQLLKKAYAVMVGRKTPGHRNLRASVARQKTKTRFYRELWHAACAAAERTATHEILPSGNKSQSTP